MPSSPSNGRVLPGLIPLLSRSHPARTGYCGSLPGKVSGGVGSNLQNHQIQKPGAAIQLLLEQFNLTPRQAEVLHWIAEGKTNQEISIIMECSFFTVKNHTKEIYARLGVSSRVAAAASTYRAIVAIQFAAQTPPPDARTKTTAPKAAKATKSPARPKQAAARRAT